MDSLQDPVIPLRRRLPPADRRRMIVEGAVAFFSEVGLDGRTRDLSKRLGVAQPLIYRYFPSKEALLEEVFQHVYIDRLDPEWQTWIVDRGVPFEDRLRRFYRAYSRAIFTYEWLRIFMFSGLAGTDINRRYLGAVETQYLKPILAEARHAVPDADPMMEDVWNLHGGVVYLGIRKFIYGLPMPEDFEPLVDRIVNRFLGSYHKDNPTAFTSSAETSRRTGRSSAG